MQIEFTAQAQKRTAEAGAARAYESQKRRQPHNTSIPARHINTQIEMSLAHLFRENSNRKKQSCYSFVTTNMLSI